MRGRIQTVANLGLENARAKLQSDIEQYRQSTQNEASETTALRSRISSLEASHRDTVSLLDSKTTAYEKLSQDLSTQSQKTLELRKQTTGLEQTIQSQNSAISNAKFKEQSLSQELELVKKSNEWLEAELKTKQSDHAKFRQEKNARVAELTRSNENHISDKEAAIRSENALRHKLEDQTQESDQALQRAREEVEARDTEITKLKDDVESANRLAELHKETVEAQKSRIADLASETERRGEVVADELGRLRAMAESEGAEKTAALDHVKELEARVDDLKTQLKGARASSTEPSNVNGGSTFTPGRPSTPMRAGTPGNMFSPGSVSRLKGTMTMTQAYSTIQELEKQLVRARTEKDQLQASLDSMIEELQSDAPQVEELTSELVRVQEEARELAALRQAISEERDRAVSEARLLRGEAEGKADETKKITQQLRDTAAQVKFLLMEQYVREHHQELSAEEIAIMEQNARLQDTSGLNATGKVISESLVVFKNISELEEQNLRSRNALRDIGDRMEAHEAARHEQVQSTLRAEIQTLHKENESLRDLHKSSRALMKTFERERDMYRGLAARKGPLPSHLDANDFSRSMPIPQGGLGTSLNGPPGVDPGAARESTQLLQELQKQYDEYKHESESSLRSLKKQADAAAEQVHQLREDNVKKASALASANTLYSNLETSQRMLKDELDALRRSRDLAMNQATEHQSRSQQLAESLVEKNSFLESARREASNLKAEKDLWKSVEGRLLEDNNNLRNDRSRLDQLNASLQNLLNEREQADSETRRRLTSQVDTLDAELQTTKRRLAEEQDESKKIVMRRDYDHDQSQQRIDDLVSTLGTTREEFAAVKTARDHLQSRVDELTIELRSAEERLTVLTQPPPQSQPDGLNESENSVSREQELAVEVSELKRDLDLKTTELDKANEEVQVYKDISQASEERLQELSDSNEQYREDTEAALAEKDKQIKDLQQRVEDISSELNTTNNELSGLRDAQSEAERRLNEQKTNLEAEIARLRDSEERSTEQAEFNLEASKAQAQIATDAQQNYENELVKHAEAAKNLQHARNDANDLRLKLKELETSTQSYQSTLVQNEESWSNLKSRYEQEMFDLKAKRSELQNQNDILHKQLETMTTQISSLQRDRASLEANADENNVQPGDEGLQEVIKFLRREKEIIDIQYHLSTQNVKSLQQQLDHAHRQLDELKTTINQQRSAALVSAQNTSSHNQLMSSITELNLYRESNVTLRAENKQSSDALAEKSKRVEELEAQIQPLEAKIAEYEGLLEMRDGEIKLLQTDRDHWQQRTQNIISKYDRVDPAELEALKEKLTAMEGERDAAKKEIETQATAHQSELQTQLEAATEAANQTAETARSELRTRLGDQFKLKVKELNGKIKEQLTKVDEAIAERDALKKELDEAKEVLEQAKAQPDRPVANGVLPEEHTDDEVVGTRVLQLEERIGELESTIALKDQEIATLKNQDDVKLKQRTDEMKTMLNKRLTDVKHEAEQAKQDALRELEERLQAQHQAELKNIQAQSPTTLQPDAANGASASSPDAQTANGQALDGDGLPVITELQARTLANKNPVIKRMLVNNIQKKLAEQEAKLKEQFEQEKATIQPPSSEDAAAMEQNFSEQREAIIKQKEDEFETEKEALLQRQQEEIESAKQALITQHQKMLEKKEADTTAMVEKKMNLKVSMADNRSKAAQAKIDVVKKAAEETPERAVGEVWEIAKDAKAPSTAKPQPTINSTAALSNVTADNSVQTSAEPTANKLASAPPLSQAPTTAAASGIPQRRMSVTTGTGPAALRQLQSGLPRGAASVRGRGGLPTGVQQTTATTTVPSAPSGRGTGGIPRGNPRGRGTGRGAAQTVQTGIPQVARQPSVAGSPKANLNPNAVQFTPTAAKRPLEDGVDGGNQGKKIRGASASSASAS